MSQRKWGCLEIGSTLRPANLISCPTGGEDGGSLVEKLRAKDRAALSDYKVMKNNEERTNKMKNTCIRLFAVALILGMGVSAEAAFTFDDIDYWIGTGSNEAALVIDWNDDKNPQSLAWGYRWDGSATSEDMLIAIAGSGFYRQANGGAMGDPITGEDERLFARISDWGWGLTVFGLGYDIDGDGGSFVPGYEGSETGYATDADDHYKEGCYNGYWSYWLANGDDPWNPWVSSSVGMRDRALSDRVWDGWSFAAGGWGSETFPDEPVAAIPEPVTMGLLALGGIALLLGRRKLS